MWSQVSFAELVDEDLPERRSAEGEHLRPGGVLFHRKVPDPQALSCTRMGTSSIACSVRL